MREIGRGADETRANRILDEVDHKRRQILVTAQYPFEEALLPEIAGICPSKDESRLLFEEANQSSEVSCFRTRFDDGVQVVRHEAVRENDKRFLDGDTQKLQQRHRNRSRFGEVTSAPIRTYREVIAPEADVLVRFESMRAGHVDSDYVQVARRRRLSPGLKTRPTSDTADPAYIRHRRPGLHQTPQTRPTSDTADPAYIQARQARSTSVTFRGREARPIRGPSPGLETPGLETPGLKTRPTRRRGPPGQGSSTGRFCATGTCC